MLGYPAVPRTARRKGLIRLTKYADSATLTLTLTLTLVLVLNEVATEKRLESFKHVDGHVIRGFRISGNTSDKVRKKHFKKM